MSSMHHGLWGATLALGANLTIAAAADLQSVLPSIASAFARETGIGTQVTYGSSGNFFTQIQNGAPFDLFLSADIAYPRRLDAAGLIVPGTLAAYATGRIVLWTRRDSGIDVRRGLSVLADPAIHRVAIANPAHAPYGRAATAALRHENLYDRVRGKLVLGENISQAAQFVQSGNAEVGVLALSLALGSRMKEIGAYYEIPAEFHAPIDQAAVVLAASRQRESARRFVDYLRKPEIARLLQSYGFEVRH